MQTKTLRTQHLVRTKIGFHFIHLCAVYRSAQWATHYSLYAIYQMYQRDAFQNVMCINNYLLASDSFLLTIFISLHVNYSDYSVSSALLLLPVTLFLLYCRFLSSSHFENVDRNHFQIKIYTYLRSE